MGPVMNDVDLLELSDDRVREESTVTPAGILFLADQPDVTLERTPAKFFQD